MKDFKLLSILNNHNTNDDEKWFFKNANIKKRNLLRALLYDENTDARKSVHKLRRICTVQEIIVIENIINHLKKANNDDEVNVLVQNLFPKKPIIINHYRPLKALDLKRTLGLVSAYAEQNKETLKFFLENIFIINECILKKDFNKCENHINEVLEKCGYSAFLIRKIILINELTHYSSSVDSHYTKNFIDEHNANGINSLLSSIQQCYQPDLDYFSLKKSLMKYTSADSFLSSMIRIPFKHRSKESELCTNLYNNLSSSLIDALIYIYLNDDLYDIDSLSGINWFVNIIDSYKVNKTDICEFYIDYFLEEKELSDIESIFYRHSSAWYEVKDIKSYKLFLDFFNDSPDSTYLDFNDDSMLLILEKYVKKHNLSTLISEISTSNSDNSNYFTDMINEGYVTKSAMFNYTTFVTNGMWMLSDKHLFLLMEQTSDLPRTIDSEKIQIMADASPNLLSKIIYYMLISRKTNNDEHGFLLRKMIQGITIEKFGSNLITLLEYFNELSPTVALYTYEVLTEDCLALMPFLIDSAFMITETRANLHNWRAEHSSTELRNRYYEMAKTLRIEHQINEIRNEIDDHRIYVDITRFNEWLFNELYINLNSAIISSVHSSLSNSESPLLLDYIDIIYRQFCTNSVFGITSYLGRRIRHGTFKGHAFSSINSALEEEFPFLVDSPFLHTWLKWKSEYEDRIDYIINEKLHIKTDTKMNGLIKPTIYDGSFKEAIAKDCIEYLIKDYEDNDGNGLISIIDEYCWNLITINLLEINNFFQKERFEIIEIAKNNLLDKAEIFLLENNIETLKPFSLDFQRKIDDKYKKINDWFQKPSSVSPKVLLSLLFTVVVKQVKETYKNFRCKEEINIVNDIEFIGSRFLCVYDALFVVIYNAAKHGKENSYLSSHISYDLRSQLIDFELVSEIKDKDTESEINQRLHISGDEDIETAQLIENNSGIKKLYNLDRYDEYFTLSKIKCYDRKVHVSFNYWIKNNV